MRNALYTACLCAVVGVFAFVPSVHATSTYTYSCTDFAHFIGTPTPTCAGGLFSFFGDSGEIYQSGTLPYTFTDGQTYYFEAITTGTGVLRLYVDGTYFVYYEMTSAGTHDFSLVAPSGNGGASFLAITAQDNSPATMTLCVSDTDGGCSGSPPPPPPAPAVGTSTNAYTFPAQGLPYQYAYCDKVASGVCLEYSFIAATTSTSTNARAIVPYGGADFYEWLMAVCAIMFMLAPITWRFIFSPMGDMQK